MAPRRIRLPLYTDTSEAEKEEKDLEPASPARGRQTGPHFTMGIGVGITIGSALIYVQLGG